MLLGGAAAWRCDLRAMYIQEGLRHHDKAPTGFARLCGNDRFEQERVVNRRCDRLYCQGRGGGFEGGSGKIRQTAPFPG